MVYGSDAFTIEDVTKLLTKLSYNDKISAALKPALTTYTAELKGIDITLPVENTYQHEGLKAIHAFILKSLQISLNNKNASFTTRVVEEKESKKLYYTDREKLEYMIEKNPKILKLIQTFGLELK